MPKVDVTDKVEPGSIDDECLYLTQCVCGKRFEAWEFIIGIYDDESISKCPACDRKLMFGYALHVYEVTDA